MEGINDICLILTEFKCGTKRTFCKIISFSGNDTKKVQKITIIKQILFGIESYKIQNPWSFSLQN